GLVEPDWFSRLEAVEADILTYDFKNALAGAQRVLLFWDAHGFEVAEVVLGQIMPELAARAHLVIMHDILDRRYQDVVPSSYEDNELWTGGNCNSRYLQLGLLVSGVEQVISIFDFSTRNGLPLHSCDHS